MTQPTRSPWRLRVWAGVLACSMGWGVCAYADSELPSAVSCAGAPIQAAHTSDAPARPALVAPPLELGAPWLAHIDAAAAAHGVDALLLQAVVYAESRFNPQAISKSGAVGLMQLMPKTAAYVGNLRGNLKALRKQLFDPQTNLDIGTRYLRNLLNQFEGRLDLGLAAYNAGVGNVRKAGNQIPPNRETPNFVNKVMGVYAALQSAALPGLHAAPDCDTAAQPASTGPAPAAETAAPTQSTD